MKKILFIAITLVLISSNSWAICKPVAKFIRGVENIVTSPVEIVKQTRWGWIEGSAKTFHISAWLLSGSVKGVAMMTARIGSGVWDIVTFPVNIPSGYQSLIKPNSVFQDWPERKAGVIYKQFGEK